MKWHRILANGLTVAGIGIACFALLGGVSTTEADQPTDRVAICHRTASQTNPYTMITVDENAVDGVAGNSGGIPDHYGEHVGPIGPIPEGEWGDIIPPVEPYHTGLNFTAEGEAIWENDCNIPDSTTTPPTEPGATTTLAPTTTTTLATTTSVASEGPVTTLAPATTLVGGESGNLPSTGQGSTMLMVGGLLMAVTGLTLRGLARRTA